MLLRSGRNTEDEVYYWLNNKLDLTNFKEQVELTRKILAEMNL
tara:strand:- start:133 stop:261 length:129 start_codon:yes stop_codon:yes gene_type:complete